MSLMPEFIFQTAILRGLEAFRHNGSLVDQLFKNLDQTSLKHIKDFLRIQAINVSINYPRSAMQLPSIVILLKNEQESQAYLGDSKGMENAPADFAYDSGTSGLVGGTASTSSMTGMGKFVFGPIQAASGTINTVSIADTDFDPEAYAESGHTVHVVMGKGVGQVRSISSNDYDTITVSKNWETTPDSTSVIEIRSEKSEIVGQPSSIYDEQDVNQLVERKGTRYETKYQLQVITGGPESTVVLAALLKSILTTFRMFLETQGIINMKIGSSDITHSRDHLPDNAYMRVLDVSFEHEFDVYVTVSDIARTININLSDYQTIAFETTADLTLPDLEILE